MNQRASQRLPRSAPQRVDQLRSASTSTAAHQSLRSARTAASRNTPSLPQRASSDSCAVVAAHMAAYAAAPVVLDRDEMAKRGVRFVDLAGVVDVARWFPAAKAVSPLLAAQDDDDSAPHANDPVSYTHLTLPTKA